MSTVPDTLSLFQQGFVPKDTLELSRYYSSRDLASGIEADSLPYSPRTDNGIALILLCCFILTGFVLARSKKLLSEMMKGFVKHRNRGSLFMVSTSGEMRFLLLLVGQTCVLAGLGIFNYFLNVQPQLMQQVPPYLLLGTYIGICLIYVLMKWIIYSFFGWIYFDKSKISAWIGAYFSLIYYLGFILFPFILFIVYFDLNHSFLVTIGLILIIFTKLLVFYKWVKIFFDNIFGLLILILYFCALEIIPYFIVYQGMKELNELFVIKF